MALQIANPVVVAKINELAQLHNITKTAAVEMAVDEKLSETRWESEVAARKARMYAILAKLDEIPREPMAVDPLQWDENGLPI
jgi:antitoxin VapB